MALDYSIPILPVLTITGALTTLVSNEHVFIPGSVSSISLQSDFTYGADGTNTKVWLQTSFDGGDKWTDIMCHAFTTSTSRKVSSVSRFAVGAEAVATDGSLADDSELDGRIGDRIRLKYTTTGTYASSTTLKVDVVLG